MKTLSLTLAIIASLLYIDYVYNKELRASYDFNVWVIQNYCKANIK